MSEVFVKAGVSGSTPLAERPEGARMLATAEKGDVDIIPKIDSMVRNTSDALGTPEEVKGQGLALHVIDLRRCLRQWECQAGVHDPVCRG